jgi:hypothetical protein
VAGCCECSDEYRVFFRHVVSYKITSQALQKAQVKIKKDVHVNIITKICTVILTLT